MEFFRRIYNRIPQYGRLMFRKGDKIIGNVVTKDSVPYYSLMLKGSHKKFLESSTFYIVLTEECLKEAIHRGEVNSQYAPPELFGRYTGVSHIEKAGRAKNTFDCIFLRVYQYSKGGVIEDKVIVLSERQFRRAIVRARSRPNLTARRKWWHGLYCKIFEKLLKIAETAK